MALDTASVQQPGFNVQFDPNPMQNREILDNSGFTGAVKSVADVLQKRQDEVRDSYDKMTSTLEEVDARDQADFLGIIEENRNQLKQLARKGVNNREYIAAKAKIFADLASKKKMSESFSAQLAEAYKYGSNPTSYTTAEYRRKLAEIEQMPLSKRKGNEIQQLAMDPNLHNVEQMVLDAVRKNYGSEVEQSYAYKKGGDVYKGTVSYSPLYKIRSNENGEIDVNNPELNLSDEVINNIINSTARPDLVKAKLDLVLPDKLKDSGAGPINEVNSMKSKLSSLIAQVIKPPRIKVEDIKLGSTSGATTVAKNLKEEESIASIADAIKSQNTKKLASNIGAQSVTFVSPEENKYLVPGLGKNSKVLRLLDKGKPEQKWSGIFIVKKDGTTEARDYDPSSPGTLAAKLYEENKANLVAGEKENEGTTNKKQRPY